MLSNTAPGPAPAAVQHRRGAVARAPSTPKPHSPAPAPQDWLRGERAPRPASTKPAAAGGEAAIPSTREQRALLPLHRVPPHAPLLIYPLLRGSSTLNKASPSPVLLLTTAGCHTPAPNSDSDPHQPTPGLRSWSWTKVQLSEHKAAPAALLPQLWSLTACRSKGPSSRSLWMRVVLHHIRSQEGCKLRKLQRKGAMEPARVVLPA